AGPDPTHADEALRIDNFDLFGLRLPDAIDVVEIGGATYYVTANEGDGRGDDPFVDGGDIARGEDLLALNIDGTEAMGVGTLVDPALLASVAATINGVDVTFEEALGDDLILGRLEFSVIDGDTDGDGDLDELFAFGGRSFTIFDESGNVVFDSGSDFEELTAVLDPSRFNADDDDDDQGNLIREFDNRSDDAGPEPEGVVTGQIGDKTYAFIGLERSSGVMVYDITDPTAPVFQEYLLPDDNPDGVENFNPEGLKFVSEADSPLGVPLLLVSYEVSNNIVVYTLEPAADDTQTLSISEIQGSSDFSALGETPVLGVDDISPFDGQEVTTTGIVTAVFQGEDSLGGFYIQSPTDDGDPLTSEGIFVASTDPVVEGDAVTVTGTVTEVDGETRVVASGVSITSSGNALPEAVTINLGVGEVDVALDTDGDYVANLEQYEGMLVTIDEPLSITELFQLDRFGTARLSSEGRLEQFTENNAPDQAGFDQHLQDVAARSIVIDDGRTDQNPDPLLAPTGQGEDVTADAGFRMGDTLDQVTGVLSYSEDPTGSEEPEFRIHQPTAEFTVENPRPEEPEDVGGTLKVAAFNVLNFFTTLDTFPGDEGVGSDQSQDPRGADTNPQNARDGVGPLDEFERQLDKLVAAIVAIDADVLGLVEIENDFLLGGLSPTDQSAVGDRDIAIQELVAAINAVAGEGTYEAVLPDGEFVGTDAISTGIIYKPAAATPVGETAVLVFEEATSDATQLVADAVAPGEVGDFPRNRPAVAATFEDAEGGQVTVAVNHFKSKGDSGLEDAIEVGEAAVAAGTLDQGVLDALLADPNVDQNDGAGFWNAVRTEAAAELAAWLETNPTGVETENQLIVGDLNSYPEETPITTLEAAGFVNTVEAIGDDTPTFVFDGQNGTLDYALASAALIDDVTGATVFATNADEADVFDYNLEFGRDPALFTADQFRASDHDPVIVGLDLGGDGGTGGGGENEIVGTPGSEVVAGTDADETFIEFATGSDRDVLTLGAGADTVIYDGQFDDGVRGTLRIADFTVGEDTISGLALDDINSSRVIGGATDAADTLILRLGDDGDRLFVRGADEISDLFGMV
ncbi:MAG: ExeM/NucH family extracellular endonuclease, partial [Pseudomonadota bacterium]